MKRKLSGYGLLFASLALSSTAGVWWGCAAGPADTTSGTGGSTSSTTTGTGATGGIDIMPDGGVDDAEAGTCTSISEKAERVPVDIVFILDRSGSMAGAKWEGTKSALTTFVNDPASIKIGVGLLYFPSFTGDTCDFGSYMVLNVPIAPLPGNSFPITNSFPAEANAYGTPTYAALKGGLHAATAYQDAHPTHKVVVVMATDGDPYGCPDEDLDIIADLAKSARNYNGVLTYVIGVEGSVIPNMNKIAEAGGTGAAYDITNDISEFSAKIAEIKSEVLGCEFEIPMPPNGLELDPKQVNFSYTPQGMGDPKVLLKADNLIDCAGSPGWYFDNNISPTKIILCPASCATVQNDNNAEVNVLFGCNSLVN
ncbi:MAG: VWA domain-containing protein [Polyangiaceae bacterium]|nr:VWA domain-containing protein [Polyangiaceae bacterium]